MKSLLTGLLMLAALAWFEHSQRPYSVTPDDMMKRIRWNGL